MGYPKPGGTFFKFSSLLNTEKLLHVAMQYIGRVL